MLNGEYEFSKLKVTNKDVLLGTKDGIKRTFEAIDKCRFKPGYHEEVDGRITCFECPMRPVCNFEITDKWMNQWYIGNDDLLGEVAYKKNMSDRMMDIFLMVSRIITYCGIPLGFYLIFCLH